MNQYTNSFGYENESVAKLTTPEDWEFFSSVYKYIGIYREVNNQIDGRHTVYLDENAARILCMKYDEVKDGIPFEKFNSWLAAHTETPLVPTRHVMEYVIGSERFLLKMNRKEYPDGCICFIQNMTELLQEQAAERAFSGTDVVTGIAIRDTLIREVTSSAQPEDTGCLAVIHINGIENLNHWFGYNYSDRGLICATKVLMQFTGKDIFLGVKSQKEYLVFFRNMDSSAVYRVLTDICQAVSDTVITDDFGEIITNGEHLLSASIGYCKYNPATDGEFDMRELLNKASFALTEARNNQQSPIQPYEEDNYLKDKEKYGDVLSFLRLINDNLFSFNFQPIVDARTGDIYAYEMLMRTKENLGISPERILEIATERNQLYDVEKATISNALNILHENRALFKDGRKLFVNSIPAHILTDEDYENFRKQYSDVMSSIIVEFTEQTEVSDQNLATIQGRCRRSNMGLAIDDYGTGYSNVSSLLSYAPNYVKIDRSMLTQIQNDVRKQHLVSNVITFAHKYGILVLAEGIEDPEELKCCIGLGADLIQGFYTSRPADHFIPGIPENIREEIRSYHNDFNSLKGDDIYNVNCDTELRLASIDTSVFSEVLINCNNLVVDGTGCTDAKLTLRTGANSSCRVVLRHVNLVPPEGESGIILGDNSTLTLVVEEKNHVKASSGIYVPPNSDLILNGNGDLALDVDSANTFGIGCDISHSFGNITVDLAGNLSIRANGNNVIGIGGGHNSNGSSIQLSNSEIEISTTGVLALNVGCMYGNPQLKMANTGLTIESRANSLVGIGCRENSIRLDIDDSEISINCSGDKVTGIGSENSGYGSLCFSHSSLNMSSDAETTVCVGTRDGYLTLDISFTQFHLNCNAKCLTGIGDHKGRGDVGIYKSTLDTHFNVSEDLYEYGSPHGELTMIETKK